MADEVAIAAGGGDGLVWEWRKMRGKTESERGSTNSERHEPEILVPNYPLNSTREYRLHFYMTCTGSYSDHRLWQLIGDKFGKSVAGVVTTTR